MEDGCEVTQFDGGDDFKMKFGNLKIDATESLTRNFRGVKALGL